MQISDLSITNNIEEKYVITTYNKIAKNFSDTRYSVWNSVTKFLNSIPKNSLVIEVGCGNGKNMLLRNDLKFFGCDVSSEFVKICNEKGLNVIEANNLCLPYSDNSFDFCLSVAVIHHLSTDDNRLNAIKELVRITKSKGKIFIEVWAFEQEEDQKFNCKKQDLLVPFKDRITGENIGNRYYHLFKKGELERIINNINNISIIDSFYEKSNWCVIVQKN